MAMSRPMEEPLCLVENTDKGLVLNVETVKVISEIQTSVSVVAIVGLYRTGKSYLLNRLMGKNSGFALGSTVQSKTKGIWVWGRPHPTKEDQYLILLDTEGLGDVEKGDQNNDSWIFSLAVLLSSSFVYNSMGTINQDAIDKLHFVTKLTELIKVKDDDDEDGTNFSQYFPAFVWTVRDFTLKLEIGGREVSPDGYLEHALELKKGLGEKVNQFNLPRQCLKSFFPERRCFVFNRPVEDKLLKNLDTIREDQLDPAFRKTADEFCDYIFQQAFPKTVRGQSLNGSMICGLVEAYLGTINSDKVPCLENAFSTMAQIENRKAIEAAIAEYVVIHKRTELPTETHKELSQLHQTFEKKAIATFLRLSFDDKDQAYQKQLQERMKEEYDRLCVNNAEASKAKCMEVWKNCSAELGQKVKDGVYTKPGGYKDYKCDLNSTVVKYSKAPKKGIMGEQMLTQLLHERDTERNSILAGDQALTDKERELAEKKKQTEQANQKAKAAEEKRIQAEERTKDIERSHEHHVQELKLKQEAETKQLKLEQERDLENKLREQKEYMDKQMKRESQEKLDEINALKEEMKNEASKQTWMKFASETIGAAANTVTAIAGHVSQYKTTKSLVSSARSAAVKATTGTKV